jgi:hypothetical protein
MEVQRFLVGLKFAPVFGTYLFNSILDAVDLRFAAALRYRTDARIFGYYSLRPFT